MILFVLFWRGLAAKNQLFYLKETIFNICKKILGSKEKRISVRYHIKGSMKLNACILHLAHMVYL